MAEPPDGLTQALAARYTIERELGAGGMATVYLAEDMKHQRKVAIKVLDPRIGQLLGADRFLREITIAARLSHPHILPLFDSGDAGGTLYYVMPYIDGESLRARLRREGPLPIGEACRLTREVAEALEYAHGEGVIHRDIKPENILLSRGHALVADFGIARAVKLAGGEQLTATGFSLGTPAYMSPEQSMGDPEIGPPADVYSLGTVLYELLTGEPPFTGATAEAVALKRFTEPVPPIRARRSDVPETVAAALTKALAKQVADRTASAAALSRALELLPAPAAPLPTPTRLDASIVVLPFDNLSPDPNDAYLADGLTDELTADLARVSALRVTARNSSVAAKRRTQNVREVAELLKVRYVLEGSVRRAGNALRITAQLIDGTTDAHVWAEKYSGTMDDVFELQERLSRTIVGALTVKLTPQESSRLGVRPVRDLRAYECYLRAKQLLWRYQPAANREAEGLLRQAMEILPDNAVLHATLAWVYGQDWHIGVAQDAGLALRMTSLVEKALALDPGCGLAWASKASLVYVSQCENVLFDQVLLLRRAVSLEPDPSSVAYLAIYCAYLGLVEESGRWNRRLLELDPLSAVSVGIGAYALFGRGDFNGFLQQMERAYELAPDHWLIRFSRAFARAYAQRVPDAVTDMVSVVDVAGDVSPAWGVAKAFLAALRRDRPAFRTVLNRYGDYFKGNLEMIRYIAPCLAHLGELDEALDWLSSAVARGFVNWRLMSEYDPFLAPLRGHPRFEALMVEARRKQAEFLALHGELRDDRTVTPS